MDKHDRARSCMQGLEGDFVTHETRVVYRYDEERFYVETDGPAGHAVAAFRLVPDN